MARILVPGVAKATVKGTNGDEPWVCTMTAFSGATGTITPTAIANLGAAVENFWGGRDFINVMPEQITVETLDVLDLGVAGSTSIETAIGAVGQLTDAVAPNSSCAVTIESVTAAGFRRPGRIFWPGLLAADHLGDNLTSAAITKYNLLWTQMDTAINGAAGVSGNWSHCLVSLHFMGTPRATGIQTPIVSSATRAKLATQVGRLRGRKRKK